MLCKSKEEIEIRERVGCWEEQPLCCQDCPEYCANPCDHYMRLIRELGNKVICEEQEGA